MKTRKKPYFGLGLGKLLVILLVVLGTTYFIWQFMFVKNSKNSKAAEISSGLTKYQCLNGIKKCPIGKTAVWKNEQCVCKKAQCTPGDQKCNKNGTKLLECSSDGAGWEVLEDCAHGCGGGVCLE